MEIFDFYYNVGDSKGASFYRLLRQQHVDILFDCSSAWFNYCLVFISAHTLDNSIKHLSTYVQVRTTSGDYLLSHVFAAIWQILIGISHRFQSNKLKKKYF